MIKSRNTIQIQFKSHGIRCFIFVQLSVKYVKYQILTAKEKIYYEETKANYILLLRLCVCFIFCLGIKIEMVGLIL